MKKKKKALLSKAVLLMLAILIFVTGRAVWDVYTKQQITKTKLEQVRGEYTELSQRRAFLEGEIARLSTETGVEEEIRRQFGLAKEGERMFVIVDSDEATTTSEKSFWEKMLFWKE